MQKIAVMVETSRAYGRSMIEGIAAFAQERRGWTIRPLTTEDAFSPRLHEFDGIIARIADERLAERLAVAKIPTVDVFCQLRRAEFARVDSNHAEIGIMARRFFESRGFEHFAFCGIGGIGFSDSRGRAFCDGETLVYSQPSPTAIDESLFYNERIDRIPDARQLGKWVKSLPRHTAVFCCNDLRAIQLQHVVGECGLSVPEDIAILGVDNDTIACSFAEVPISSIDPNAFKVGHAAARTLSAIIANPPSPRLHKVHQVNPGKIYERASTEFMPIDPPWLGNVLMHIERNLCRPIGASDIFALAERSSTYVENIFRKRLGMSTQAYITERKLQKAKELLNDRQYRISEIATACGYASPQYFCRVFTAATGVSPKRYRGGLG